MNTVAIFFSAIAATAAYSAGFNTTGNILLAIGFLAAAAADAGNRHDAAVAA